MKLRNALPVLAVAIFAMAGCGSDDNGGGSKDSKEKKKDGGAELSKEQREDRKVKEDNVADAKQQFEDEPKDVNACRNLAMAYVALASPASATDPKDTPELPEDRDENLKRSIETLEQCVDMDAQNRDVRQMLASTYMAVAEYDKATPLLAQLARSAKGQERANAYYAWGLAASNAQEYAQAVTAYQGFLDTAQRNDPRVAQVRSSIKALRQAARTPPAGQANGGGDGNAAEGEDAGEDANPDDAGGEDAPEDGGEGEDKG